MCEHRKRLIALKPFVHAYSAHAPGTEWRSRRSAAGLDRGAGGAGEGTKRQSGAGSGGGGGEGVGMEMSSEDVERMHREMRKGIEYELHVRTIYT